MSNIENEPKIDVSTKTISNLDRYRAEVKHKIGCGEIDYENTIIKIDKRDMYSILAELGIEVLTKPTNYSIHHLEWDKTSRHFLDLMMGKLTLGAFVRAVKSSLNKDVAITTFRYKLREFNIDKKRLGYNEFVISNNHCLYSLIQDRIEFEKRDRQIINDEYIIELAHSYSIGEICNLLDLNIYDVNKVIQAECERDNKLKQWVEFLNIYNPNSLEYRVDMVSFVKDIYLLSVNKLSEKYKIPKSTIKDWLRKYKGSF